MFTNMYFSTSVEVRDRLALPNQVELNLPPGVGQLYPCLISSAMISPLRAVFPPATDSQEGQEAGR